MSRHDLSSPGGLRTTTNRPFPFFELPREVRDQVYSNLVVRRDSRHRPVIEATAILKNRKKRVAAQIIRDRLNRQRISSGKRPICNRSTSPDPLLHLDVLRASRRVYCEASDSLYSTNWFAISLSKLPSTVFETPYGWNLSRVKKLQLELQIKDAVRMNSYIDWAPLFASFSSLRVLRIVLTFHPRYYEWAHTELCDWQTTPYVHKAFFRELLAAIPGHVDLKIGSPMDEADGLELQGKAMVEKKLLWDMILIMSFLRPMSMLRSSALRPAALSAAPRARLQVRFATQDYGSGKGNPAGERPEKQGQNPSESLEHPGPPPPKVAQGKSSSSPDQDSNSNQNEAPKPTSESPTPSSNKGSSGKREFSTSARQLKASKEPAVQQGLENKPKPSEVKGAQPKILNESPPASEDESEDASDEDVKKDKVSDGFWKGM
ncbi:hypothetical protein EJ02DRAFT_332870 [Clathrospora elynae]|uniref:DUF7730 domain-containing protein n=1 Tax=Clathrospora elynae TaxID=706981 RepID=A0A6A5T6G8_9PLEO|nr:hypothetical protein EJ02DRAFT_332870 [Clathrospora elynae]